MKRPLEGTGEGNVKKSKTLPPPDEEPSTSGIQKLIQQHQLFVAKEIHGEKEVMVEVSAGEVYREEV